MAQSTGTFRDFINQEMRRRDMSARQFADFVGVSHTTISRTLDPDSPYTPGLDFIVKVAKATGVSLSTLVSLVVPDAPDPDPGALILAERIMKLPEDKRQIAEAFILGTLLKSRDEEG